MISVRINGDDSGITSQGAPSMADLVELIKANIDPDHMITGIVIDGRDIEDHEWQASTAQFQTAILEVETGPVSHYVGERLEKASSIVGSCFVEFRKARKCFQEGNMNGGNKVLVEATNALKAFFEWYGTLMQLLESHEQSQYSIDEHLNSISEVCKRICQQQLYQSWWALGETIEKELEPRLEELEDALRRATSGGLATASGQ